MTTYTLSELNDFRDASKDWITFKAVDGSPVIEFQDNLSSGAIKFATRVSDGMPLYILDLGGDNYQHLSYANVTNVGFYYIDPSFDAWLDTNYSHLFSGQNITFENGTFTDVYVTKKPNYTYNPSSYTNFWSGNDHWTAPNITSFSSYLDGLSGYDIRLFQSHQDADWYDQIIKDGIESYVKDGVDNPIIPPESPVPGNIYTADDFTNPRAAGIDVVILLYENDVPTLHFQNDDETHENCEVEKVDFHDGTIGYVHNDGDASYTFIAPTNDSALGLVLVDNQLVDWMKDNHSHMFTGLNITLNTGVFTNVFIARNPNFMTDNFEVIWLDQNNTNFWGVPNTADISGYLNSIPNVDVKFYPDSTAASWYNNVVQDAIRDAVITAIATDPIDPTLNTDTSGVNVANLIYTKSLYESSAAYFDSTIARLQQELAEEQNLQNVLSTDETELINDLQNFIDTKAVEVNNKVNNLNQINSDLRTLVSDNLNSINTNEQLSNFLNSSESTDLSNKILELRDKVYDSIKFLSDNQRLGRNEDIVYLVSKVQI